MTRTTNLDNCGCCAGVDQETPVKLTNLPSQSTLSYRIGTHSKFKESMLAALTNAKRPALLPLGTRDDDDFTIAFGDSEPLKHRRYVLINDQVHLMNDLHYHFLLQPGSTYLNLTE